MPGHIFKTGFADYAIAKHHRQAHEHWAYGLDLGSFCVVYGR